jgi:hypothetical protein
MALSVNLDKEATPWLSTRKNKNKTRGGRGVWQFDRNIKIAIRVLKSQLWCN